MSVHVPPWQRIDRDDLVSFVQRGCSSAKAHVVRGSDDDGRFVAANLVEEILTVDVGMTVVRILERPGVSPKHLLRDAWRLTSPEPQARSVPPWVGTFQFITPAEICDEIAHVVSPGSAFVFDTVDADIALERGGRKAFGMLAAQTGTPVFIMSRAEVGTQWADVSVLDLGMMCSADASRTLFPIRSSLGVSAEDLDQLISKLDDFSNADGICAQDMYDLVAAALPGGD